MKKESQGTPLAPAWMKYHLKIYIQKISEAKSGFFEKIHKIDKSLIRPIKKKEDPNKWNQKWKRSNNDTKEIQRIIRKYYEHLYADKLGNLDGMDKLLETYNLPKLNQEESALNRQIATSEIEAVKKNLLINKSFGLMASQVHFTKHSMKS